MIVIGEKKGEKEEEREGREKFEDDGSESAARSIILSSGASV